MVSRKKVVIFFTELSDYILNVFLYWVKSSEIELYIFRTSVNENEAPFKFALDNENMHLLNRETFDTSTLLDKVEEINPEMIICAGWSDKGYLKTVSKFSKKIPTVMTMDNQWRGSFKQYFAVIFSRFTIKKIFDHVWVPGEPQAQYAKKLGFSDKQIAKGFYVANKTNFDVKVINPEKKFSKRFIFLGRYIEKKGIRDLWQAFIELHDEQASDWELWCIGTGPLYEEKVEHPKIKHIGFVQPKDLRKYISEGGVFILPSYFEAWGVVVHEFAYAGFPLIVSDAVGAGTQFVENGVNGYIFNHKSKIDLKNKMKIIMSLTKEDLKEMGNKSYDLANVVTEEFWTQSANRLLKGSSFK